MAGSRDAQATTAPRRVPTILAVDGGSLGHRAWHAIDDHRTGPFVAGGVVSMLATAWAHGPFDGVVLALDSPNSVRREQFPGYKAHRPPPDPELLRQLDRLGDIAAAAGFAVLSSDGYEADDLLGVTAAAAQEAGVGCALLSSDRDLLAHVGGGVVALRPRTTMADLKVYGPAEVEEEFGVPPARYLQLAALRGDPSDGLAGVPGVGLRTAARLLSSFGGLDALYAGLHHLDPPLRRALTDARSRVERNLRLMQALGDHRVDVPGILERGLDVGGVVAALRAAGLARAATAFRLAVQRPAPPPVPPPPHRDTTDHGRPDRTDPDPSDRRTTRPVARTGDQVPLFGR